MTKRDFYIKDHALLFAWLARAVEDRAGQGRGRDLVEAWVKAYGRERGLRSAKRCLDDGQILSLSNYFVYSEWHDERGWNRNRLVSLAPYHFEVVECGWNRSWREINFMGYGRLYCRWIDYALVKGFNRKLRLEMSGTLSAGAGCCGFYWPDHAFSEAELEELAERRAAAQPRVTRDFLYHMAHLYDALRRVLIPRLGLEAAEAILERGLHDYSVLFGREKADILLEAAKQTFTLTREDYIRMLNISKVILSE